MFLEKKPSGNFPKCSISLIRYLYKILNATLWQPKLPKNEKIKLHKTAAPATIIQKKTPSLSPPVKNILPIKYTDIYGTALHNIPTVDKKMLAIRNGFPLFE